MFDRPKGGKTKSTFKNKDHGIWPHHFMANRQGENGNVTVTDFIFLDSKSLWMVTAAKN